MNVRKGLLKIKEYCIEHYDCDDCVFNDDFLCSLKYDLPSNWGEQYTPDGVKMMENIHKVINYCKEKIVMNVP